MTLHGREFLPESYEDNGSNGECECAELLDSKGKRRAPFPGHDCEYVRARSALVPQAVRIANACVATRSPSEDGGLSNATSTKVFAEAMDDLARPLLRQIRQWPLLATQFAPQGSQAEQSATEQRNC
jgi:hypothetical protein